MDEWIQLVLFIVFGAIALLGRLFGRRGQKAEPDVVLEDEEVVLPPWGNVPMEDESPFPEAIEPETLPVQPTPTPTVQAPRETSRQPTPESRTDSSPPQVPTIAGIPLSPQTFRQGIILAEILGSAKSLRRPRQ